MKNVLKLLGWGCISLICSCQSVNWHKNHWRDNLERDPSSDELFLEASAAPTRDGFKKLNRVPTINIENNSTLNSEEIALLRNKIELAIRFFEEITGEVAAPVNVNLGAGGTNLRIGFDPEKNTIYFRDIAGVEKLGTASIDIVNHELFHALMYQKVPEAFSPERMKERNGVALHEAFADFFAYVLNPDEHFGENYYNNGKTSMRTYLTGSYLGLVDASHVIGNVLVSILITKKEGLKSMWEFIKKGAIELEALKSLSLEVGEEIIKQESFKVQYFPIDVPPSSVNRYRLAQGQELKINFIPNALLLHEHPDLEIVWTKDDGVSLPEHFQFSSSGENPFNFVVTLGPTKKTEKILALYVSNGITLGGATFYFGASLNKDDGVKNLAQ